MTSGANELMSCPSDCLDGQRGRPFHSTAFVLFRADDVCVCVCLSVCRRDRA